MKRGVCLGLGFLLLAACGGGSDQKKLNLASALLLDFANIDYAAVMAQRDKFKDGAPPYPMVEFGYMLPPNSASPDGKANVQPSYWAPLGTVVRAPSSGKVYMVPQLYSGDYSVHIERGDGAVWETEHVLDPLVKPGDEVVAGQPVAKVSDYECEYSRRMFGNEQYCSTGIGVVEFGLLVPGAGAPIHECPYAEANLDPAHRDEMFRDLAAARAKVEAILGDPNFYDEESWESPNCITAAPIEG